MLKHLAFLLHAVFDVASIKPSPPRNGSFQAGAQPGGRFVARNAGVKSLIQIAWGVRDFQVLGGPAWASSPTLSDLYDIDAKGDLGDGGIMLPLSALLADRFKLVVHHESRDQTVYLLDAAKNGPKFPKLKESAAGTEHYVRMAGPQLVLRKTSMAQLAFYLSEQPEVRHSVTDNTGMHADFDLTLDLFPRPLKTRPSPRTPRWLYPSSRHYSRQASGSCRKRAPNRSS